MVKDLKTRGPRVTLGFTQSCTRGFTQSCTRGFTLVELLVVISIIGVLVGLTVPAVQSVRSAARQTTCMNSMRQCAVAARTHETNLGYLPYYWSTYGSGSTKNAACWVVPLLPHLGETAMWQKWESGTTNYNTLNYLVCPDTPEKKKKTAGLSYAANCGYCTGSAVQHDSGKVYAFQLGAFVSGDDKRSMTSKMKDGAAYTILFSENNQASAWNVSDPAAFGIFWFNSYSPNSRTFGSDHKSTSTDWNHARPSSYHPQDGANVAFADGGVKYCTRSMTTLLYSQLMAPDDAKASSYYSALKGASMDLKLIER